MDRTTEVKLKITSEGWREILQEFLQFQQSINGSGGSHPVFYPPIGGTGSAPPVPPPLSGLQTAQQGAANAVTSNFHSTQPLIQPTQRLTPTATLGQTVIHAQTILIYAQSVTVISQNVSGAMATPSSTQAGQTTTVLTPAQVGGQLQQQPQPGDPSWVTQFASSFMSRLPFGGKFLGPAALAYGAYNVVRDVGTALAEGIHGRPIYAERFATDMFGWIPGIGDALRAGADRDILMGQIRRWSRYSTVGLGDMDIGGWNRGLYPIARSGLGAMPTSALQFVQGMNQSGFYGAGEFAFLETLRARQQYSANLADEILAPRLQEYARYAMDPYIFNRAGFDALSYGDHSREAMMNRAVMTNPFSPLLIDDPSARRDAWRFSRGSYTSGLGQTLESIGRRRTDYILRYSGWNERSQRLLNQSYMTTTAGLMEQESSLRSRMDIMEQRGMTDTQEYMQTASALQQVLYSLRGLSAEIAQTTSHFQTLGAVTKTVMAQSSYQISLIQGAGGMSVFGSALSTLAGVTGERKAAEDALARLRAAGFSEGSEAVMQAKQRLASQQVREQETQLSMAVAPMSAATRMDFSNVGTALSVSRTTFAGYADIRGLLGGQMRLIGRRMSELDEWRNSMRSSGRWTEGMESEYTQQRNQLVMEAASVQQNLEQGWLDRLVSQTWNAPSSFNMVASQFTRREASLFHGIAPRAFGGTREQTTHWRLDTPALYMGLIGRTGTPEGMMETAMAGSAMAHGITGSVNLNVRIQVEQAGNALKDAANYQINIQNATEVFEDIPVKVGVSHQ